MAKTYHLLSACGSGIATSSHVAASLKNGLKERGIDVDVRTCGVIEINGLIANTKPDAIIATTTLETVANLGDIKVISGVPLLTGIKKKQMLDDLADYLENNC